MYLKLNKSVEKWIDSKEFGFNNRKKKNASDDSAIDKSIKTAAEEDDTQKTSEPYTNRKSGLKFLSAFSKFFSSDWLYLKLKSQSKLKYEDLIQKIID